MTAFGRPLEIGDDVLKATVCADASDSSLSERQSVLFELCDELHETSTLSSKTWDRLSEHFDELQILELIYTVGMYHSVSFLVNALDLENEEFGARFSELTGDRPSEA